MTESTAVGSSPVNQVLIVQFHEGQKRYTKHDSCQPYSPENLQSSWEATTRVQLWARSVLLEGDV